MNFLTLVTSVGTGQFIIFSIFSGSILNLSVPIVCPKNLIFLCPNLHFFSLITRFASRNLIKTFLSELSVLQKYPNILIYHLSIQLQNHLNSHVRHSSLISEKLQVRLLIQKA